MWMPATGADFPSRASVDYAQHDLASCVMAQAQFECGSRLREREHGGDHRPQRCRVDQARDLDELVAVGLDHEVHTPNPALAERCLVELRNEAHDDTALAYHSVGAGQRIAADGIEHDVYIADFVFEAHRVIVDNLLRAELS